MRVRRNPLVGFLAFFLLLVGVLCVQAQHGTPTSATTFLTSSQSRNFATQQFTLKAFDSSASSLCPASLGLTRSGDFCTGGMFVQYAPDGSQYRSVLTYSISLPAGGGSVSTATLNLNLFSLDTPALFGIFASTIAMSGSTLNGNNIPSTYVGPSLSFYKTGPESSQIDVTDQVKAAVTAQSGSSTVRVSFIFFESIFSNGKLSFSDSTYSTSSPVSYLDITWASDFSTASLDGLDANSNSVGALSISPAVSAGVTSYTATTPSWNTLSVRVTATFVTAGSVTAWVSTTPGTVLTLTSTQQSGSLTLPTSYRTGSNVRIIVRSSADGRDYTFTLARSGSPSVSAVTIFDNTNTALTLNQAFLSSSDPTSRTYTSTISSSVTSLSVTATFTGTVTATLNGGAAVALVSGVNVAISGAISTVSTNTLVITSDTDGSFSFAIGTVAPTPCNNVPVIAAGAGGIATSTCSSSTLASGGTCDITCNGGYTKIGTAYQCSSGTLTGGGLSCAAQGCTLSLTPTTGVVIPTCASGFASGSTCSISCSAGYTLAGTPYVCTAGTVSTTVTQTCSPSSCSVSVPSVTGLVTDCTNTLAHGATCSISACPTNSNITGTPFSCSFGVLSGGNSCTGVSVGSFRWSYSSWSTVFGTRTTVVSGSTVAGSGSGSTTVDRCDCGTGAYQRRDLLCRDSVTGVLATNTSLCGAAPAPQDIYRPCPSCGYGVHYAYDTWGTCSASCNGGVQVRNVVCVDDTTGNTLGNNNACSGQAVDQYPGYKSICNTQPCNIIPRWVITSDWSACNATCGNAWQSRTVDCQDQFGSSITPPPVNTTGTYCDLQSTPDTLRRCTVPTICSLVYSYNYTNYTSCSRPCGTGFQTRNATCVSNNSTLPLNISLCISAIGAPVATNITCSNLPNCTYVYNPFGTCSNDCGAGTISLNATCIFNSTTNTSSTIIPVPLNFCTETLPAPETSTSCNRGTCGWTTVLLDSGACNATCGVGYVSSRSEVRCLPSLCPEPSTLATCPYRVAPDNYCDPVKPPVKPIPCTGLPSCASNIGIWSIRSTSACSVQCGGGSATRDVQCVSSGNTNTILGDAACPIATAGLKPQTLIGCNTDACPGQWQYGAAGACRRVGSRCYMSRTLQCVPNGSTCPSFPGLMTTSDIPCTCP